MKKAIPLLCLLCALLLCAAAHADDGVMREGISSVELTRLMGNGINLGNTLEACDNSQGCVSDSYAHYETLWGQPITTPEMLSAMKAAGFDTIRIPVAWMTNATHLASGDYTIASFYLDRVEEVVNYALDAGMYVILNDHWDGGWYGMFGSDSAETRTLAMEAYKGMWTQLSERFAAYGDHLIFEGANEEIGARFDENSPLYCDDSITHYLSDDERYALANEVNQAFVDTVRATGGNNATRFLLIPGYGTDIVRTCDSRFVMPRDSAEDKLLISVHFYSPWSYCGASSAAGATRWGTQSDFAAVREELQQMRRFVEAGIGVVIGEYGALPGADGVQKENSIAYHQYFLDACDAFDYTNCLWDCSGFFIRSKLSFATEELAALYDSRRLANEGELAEVQAAALAAMDAAEAAAPATFRADAVSAGEDTCVAWIMWNSGDWQLSYSVGDTYNPDSISAGLKATDVVIEGEGTYTVALDFTGTAPGYSNGVAFSALGIANGETLHPGWAVHVQECRINGEVYTMKGRPYTTSDDHICTRVNLYNEWVTKVPADARVLYGPPIGASPTPINRSDEVISHIETIEITFVYGPKQ